MDNVKLTKLSNGVRVVTNSTPNSKSVCIGILAGVGSRYESDAEAGLSHFVEHMVFKGSNTRTSKQITDIMEGCGGECNAYTDHETTVFHVSLPYYKLKTGFDVLSDFVLNPRMDSSDIDTERDVILEEIKMYQDNMREQSYWNLYDSVWVNHDIGRPVIGYSDVVSKVNKKKIEAFIKKYYTPSNLVFAFTGNVEHDKCVEMVNNLSFPNKDSEPSIKFKRVTNKIKQNPIIVKECDNLSQSHVTLGYRVSDISADDSYIMDILVGVLGQGSSSRLFQRLREKNGLCYCVYASSQLFKETGIIQIYSSMTPEKSQRSIDLILKEINRLKSARVGKSELKRSIEYCIGTTLLALENNSVQMNMLLQDVADNKTIRNMDEMFDIYRKITSDEILNLAETIFDEDALTLSIVQPIGNSQDFDISG